MPLKAPSKRERVVEDEYFHRLDVELMDQMRERAAVEEERRQLAEASKIQDQRLLDDLARVGFNPRNATLLHLVPLIQVAWVDRSVSRAERDRIVKVARLRGIEEGCAADQQLTMWLDQRPSDEVFETAVRALRPSRETSPSNQNEASARSLLERCEGVAAASGGFFGLTTPVSAAERELLDDLARKLLDHPVASPQAVAGVAGL
jgi:hypothetical protein